MFEPSPGQEHRCVTLKAGERNSAMAWGNQKHVPTALRNACLKRDGYQCTATMQDGSRCIETKKLEAHHLKQWSENETPALSNLVTLCHWHHQRVTVKQAAEARKQAKAKLPSAKHPQSRHPGLL